VYVVNCARGALVDQDALLAGLSSGQVAGAGLDVTDPEPLPVDHPLLGHPRVIVTPHCASSTGAGRLRLFEHAIDNALGVLSGGPATIVKP
jgi:glyoxylate reductase